MDDKRSQAMQRARLAYIVGNEAPCRQKEFRSLCQGQHIYSMACIFALSCESSLKDSTFFYYCREYIVMMRSRIWAGVMPFF
jgi:hypothetical protein